MKVFVDTSFFVALTDKSDKHFTEARDCFLSQLGQNTKLVTSNVVFAETITCLRYRAGFKFAKEFGEKFRHSQIIQTVTIDTNLEQEAWRIFLKYRDQELSYVDCLSFAYMKHNQLDTALTFDKHFRLAGFTTLPA